MAIVLAVFSVISSEGIGQQPSTKETSKEPPANRVDWDGLRSVLEAGDYAKATAAADAILEQVKPDRTAPDFLPRSVDTIDALMRRGFAELQLSKLDAADASLAATQAIFKDREFLKQVGNLEKRGGPRAAAPLIDLDLRFIELQHLRAAVALERLRLMGGRDAKSNAAGAAADPGAPELARAQVEAIRAFMKDAADVRTKLQDRFGMGGPTIVDSPHKNVLMSSFHPDLITGMLAFRMSRLPFDLPAAPAPEPPPKGGAPPEVFELDGLDPDRLLARALEYFEKASKTLDEVFEKVLPKGVATAVVDKRLEAEILRLRLVLARSEARFQAGDLAGTTGDLDEIFRLHKAMATARKLAKPESHPELVIPLARATAIALAESDARVKAGLGDEARALVAKASETLAKASAVSLPEDHPWRKDLQRLETAIENRLAAFEAAVVVTDAADVVAERIRRAVEGTKPGQ
jgi:hypothetical protein